MPVSASADASAFAAIFEQVVDAARSHGVKDVEAIFAGETSALTRFANNAIHQNVSEQSTQLSIRPVLDGRTARATTNRLDREGIRRVVEEAVALARLTEPDPDLPPLAEPAPVETLNRDCESTAQATPEERARAVAEAIGEVEAAGQTAAGIYSTGGGFFGLRNSRGVAAWHSETMARFSITAMADDSSGLGQEPARAIAGNWMGRHWRGGRRKKRRRHGGRGRLRRGGTRWCWSRRRRWTWWGRCSAISAPRRCATGAASW